MTWKASHANNHAYLDPAVLRAAHLVEAKRLLDIGCGVGGLTARLAAEGIETAGLDRSEKEIERARSQHPEITFVVHDVNDHLPGALREAFDTVVATEIIEHLFSPRAVFDRATEALSAGGHLILSTPYHGYWKNLAMAVTGKLERHLSPRDFGHIKFFTEDSLRSLASMCGFRPVRLVRVGRIGPLAATMVMTAVKINEQSVAPQRLQR